MCIYIYIVFVLVVCQLMSMILSSELQGPVTKSCCPVRSAGAPCPSAGSELRKNGGWSNETHPRLEADVNLDLCTFQKTILQAEDLPDFLSLTSSKRN